MFKGNIMSSRVTLWVGAPIVRSHHPAKFGGQRHCGSRYKMVLVCHVILQDHVIKGLCDFMGSSQSRSVTILLNLVAIGTLVVDM